MLYREIQSRLWRNTKNQGLGMVPARCRVVGHKGLVRGEGTCMHIANYYKYNSKDTKY